ncbi:MAG TPA: hypothetical protein VGH89_05970 [Pseudonocardia sp.]
MTVARSLLIVGALVLGSGAVGAPAASAVAWAVQRPVARSIPDVCVLLSSAQRHQLRVLPGATQPNGGPGSPGACSWRSFALPPWGGEYVAKVLHGPAPAGNPAPSINNLPTVEYRPDGQESATSCVYLLTVEPETTLWAQYSGPNQQGLSHLVACRRAQAAAAAMSSTYRGLPRSR